MLLKIPCSSSFLRHVFISGVTGNGQQFISHVVGVISAAV
uniref:Uncharacterized protein n=1 Tax=Siphoviridae sp. ctsoB6 TaxID=2826487 RepID=A0A8S5QQ64_9CAUD|nr:MAG TPA: hypothetical protein [Siphoviridae sp. ctsoB6]